MLPLIQARREAHLPRILATKETATVEAAVDEEDVIRSRCEKAAQVGIDIHTHKARKLLCNLDIISRGCDFILIARVEGISTK